MGEKKVFCLIEAKKFEFVLERGGDVAFLRVVERGRGFTERMSLGLESARSLVAAVEGALKAKSPNFIKSFREVNKVFVVQKQSNERGGFLLISELGVGKRLGLIIVPEGRKGKGWADFLSTLKGVLHPNRAVVPEFVTAPNKNPIAWKDSTN